MEEYKYHKNFKKNVMFSKEKCQFCGSEIDCLEGTYFDNPEIKSVCVSCFKRKKAEVLIPEFIKNKIKKDLNQEIEELKYTPPVPWIQYNDWQVCCDDFCIFIGEWKKEDFIREALDYDPIEFFKSLLNEYTLSLVDDINILWNDIGNNTAAFVFECAKCNRKIVVCQSY
ncbi:CbrC family protein [Treponema sp.]|uniref:CbrC family protein n=1 Tax=Treponema sp. TaxID=166 RepID=UPI00388CFDCD